MISPLFIDRDERNDEVKALAAEHRDLVARMRAGAERGREIEQAIDDLRLAERPSLPTSNQEYGLLEALRRIRRGEVPSSHHGDPCCEAPGSYDVKVDGRRGWISVAHKAPYAQRRRGYKLWHLTDDEIAAIHDLLAHEGYQVTDSWKHDDGISLIVAPIA